MNLVYFSDTHGKHRDLDLPDGDLLICGGGVSGSGKDDEIIDFIRWFDRQKHFYKVFMAGRTDRGLDPKFGGRSDISDQLCDELASYCVNGTNHYLEDSYVEIEGLVISGMTTTLGSAKRAFAKQESRLVAQKLSQIPKSIHILVTNYPPLGMLDYAPAEKDHIGDSQLKAWVEHIHPDLLLVGGAYQSRGVTFKDGIAIVNGSSYDPDKNHVRPAWHMFYGLQSGKTRIWKDTTPFKV